MNKDELQVIKEFKVEDKQTITKAVREKERSRKFQNYFIYFLTFIGVSSTIGVSISLIFEETPLPLESQVIAAIGLTLFGLLSLTGGFYIFLGYWSKKKSQENKVILEAVDKFIPTPKEISKNNFQTLKKLNYINLSREIRNIRNRLVHPWRSDEFLATITKLNQFLENLKSLRKKTLEDYFLELDEIQGEKFLETLKKQVDIKYRIYDELNKGFSQVVTMLLTFSAFMFIIISLLWDKEAFNEFVFPLKIVLTIYMALSSIPLIITIIRYFGLVMQPKMREPLIELFNENSSLKIEKERPEVLTFKIYSDEITYIETKYEKRREILTKLRGLVIFYIIELFTLAIFSVMIFSGVL